MYEIIGMDTPCMDLLCHVSHLPCSNESLPLLSQSWQGGGKVATGMVASAMLGAKVAALGVVGEDIYGTFCRADFQKHGIDTRGLLTRKNQRTAFSLVLSDKESGGRNIIHTGSEMQRLTPEEVDFEKIRTAKVLHLAHCDAAALAAAKFAKENGVKVLFDADGYQSGLTEMYPFIHTLIASEFVYRHYFGDNAYEENLRQFAEHNIPVVIFTFGEKGCAGYSCETGYFHLPAFPVEVVDTVGAGDVFHGAYAYCMTREMSPKQAARFSSAVSAIKCTCVGGRAGIPTLEHVTAFLETGKICREELAHREAFYERGLENLVCSIGNKGG